MTLNDTKYQITLLRKTRTFLTDEFAFARSAEKNFVAFTRSAEKKIEHFAPKAPEKKIEHFAPKAQEKFLNILRRRRWKKKIMEESIKNSGTLLGLAAEGC